MFSVRLWEDGVRFRPDANALMFRSIPLATARFCFSRREGGPDISTRLCVTEGKISNLLYFTIIQHFDNCVQPTFWERTTGN